MSPRATRYYLRDRRATSPRSATITAATELTLDSEEMEVCKESLVAADPPERPRPDNRALGLTSAPTEDNDAARIESF